MFKTENKQQGILASIGEFAFLLLIVFLIRTIGFGLYQVPTGSMETTMLVGERFFADKFTYLFRGPKKGEIISFNDPTFKYSHGFVKRIFEEYVWGPSNWTKRVIGVPGDVVRGVIEDGKPVIYVNDQKIDEPYLNKYPLIHVFKQNPSALRAQVEQEIRTIAHGRTVDQGLLNKLIEQRMIQYTNWKSYDQSKPFEQQQFYRINRERLYPQGGTEAELLYPGTPLPPKSAAQSAIEQKRNYWDGSDVFYVKLPADKYWVMGDNRLGSKDCRFFGPISKSLIHGRIVFRIWSIDSDESWWIFDLIKHPVDFFKRVRWSRFFQWIY